MARGRGRAKAPEPAEEPEAAETQKPRNPADPENFETYNALMCQRATVSGFGIDGVTQHFPCPFCAAEDWLVVKLIDFAQDHEETCSACGRSARLVYSKTPDSSSMQVVQTGGDDPPEWLVPAPPRQGASG